MTKTFTRRFLGLLGIAAVSASVTAQKAEAAGPAGFDTRGSKLPPNVLMLVDNSGSMSRMPDSSLPCAAPPCTTSTKNRWQSVVDVLGGPLTGALSVSLDRSQAAFKGLYGSSVYDASYGIPHFLYGSPTSVSKMCTYLPASGTSANLFEFDFVAGAKGSACTPAQSGYDGSSGFFAALTNKARIGMMMFDSDPVASNNEAGLWSYAPLGEGAVSYPGCSNNVLEVGARSTSAPQWEGQLVPFPPVESATTTSATNLDTLRTVLRASRPFGATPIAGMLTDAKGYLATTGNCHDQVVVLLTDGAPNLDGRPACAGYVPVPDASAPDGGAQAAGYGCPYKRPEEIAAELQSAGVTTYVVGFSVTGNASGTGQLPNNGGGTFSSTCDGWYKDPSGPGTPAAMKAKCDALDAKTGYWAAHAASPDPNFDLGSACCSLNRIAVAGGTTAAKFADNAADMANVIQQLQERILAGADSRAVPVTSPRTAAGQSIYGTAYVTGGGTGVARGDIQRIGGYTCDGTTSTPTTITPTTERSIGTRLGLQARLRDRDFFTVRTSTRSATSSGLRDASISIQPANYKYLKFNTVTSTFVPDVTVPLASPLNTKPMAVLLPEFNDCTTSWPGAEAPQHGSRYCSFATYAHAYTDTPKLFMSGSQSKEFLDYHDLDLRGGRKSPSGMLLGGVDYSQPDYFTPPGGGALQYIPGMRSYNGLDQAMMSFLMAIPNTVAEYQGGITGNSNSYPQCADDASNAAKVAQGELDCAAVNKGNCSRLNGTAMTCTGFYPPASPLSSCGSGGDTGEHQCPFNNSQYRCPVGSPTCNALGPIGNAVPVIVGPPNEYLPDESYQAWIKTLARNPRDVSKPMPSIMYVQEGGLLHAFDTTTNVDHVELWAFIPPAMQSSLGSLFHSMAYPLLDTTPIVRDVPMYIQESEVGFASLGNLGSLSQRWRRVLVSGLGNQSLLSAHSGYSTTPRGYYAVDVTHPMILDDTEKKKSPSDLQDLAKVGGPKFLWQLTDVPWNKLAKSKEELATAPPSALSANAHPLLIPNDLYSDYQKAVAPDPNVNKGGGERGTLFGAVTGTPAVTTVAYRDSASVNYANQVAVAILPGGTDGEGARGSAGTYRVCSARQTHDVLGTDPVSHDQTVGTPYALHASHLCWGPRCYTTFGATDSTYTAGCNEVVKGRYVVIARMDTGEVIRVFGRKNDFKDGTWGATASTNYINPTQEQIDSRTVIDTPFDAPMTGTPAVYPMNTGAVATKFFMSDAEGVIWRFDISSNDPSNWRADIFFDTRNPSTISTPEDWRQVEVPIEMSRNDDGELVLFVATGEQKKLTDALSTNYVYSLTETVNGRVGSAKVNHLHELPIGRRVVGPMIVNDSTLFYSLFRANGDGLTCPADSNSLLCIRHYKDAHATPKWGGALPDPMPITGLPLSSYQACLDMGAPVLSGVALASRPSCTVPAVDDIYGALPPSPTGASQPGMSLVWTTGIKLSGDVPEVKLGSTSVTQSAAARRTILDSWVAILE